MCQDIRQIIDYLCCRSYSNELDSVHAEFDKVDIWSDEDFSIGSDSEEMIENEIVCDKQPTTVYGTCDNELESDTGSNSSWEKIDDTSPSRNAN